MSDAPQKSSPHGPLWQLEQNLKNYRMNAKTWRDEAKALHDEAQVLLRHAETAEKSAVEYETAIAVLKGDVHV